jgi:hypothetical protein
MGGSPTFITPVSSSHSRAVDDERLHREQRVGRLFRLRCIDFRVWEGCRPAISDLAHRKIDGTGVPGERHKNAPGIAHRHTSGLIVREVSHELKFGRFFQGASSADGPKQSTKNQ